MFLLEVEGLTLRVSAGSSSFAGGSQREVLRGASLTVPNGQTVGLIGRSGEGKTSIARCVAGLTPPDAGTISFDGLRIFPEVENRRQIGCAIQMVFQAGSTPLNPRLTILSSLAEAIRANRGTSPEEIESRAIALLESVHLSPEILKRMPDALSGGQKQRVSIARALAVSPRLLILDEPTSALDPLTQSRVLDLLTSLQQSLGFAMLYITHDLPAALRFCHELAILAEGRIVEQGLTGVLHSHPRHPVTEELLRTCRVL